MSFIVGLWFGMVGSFIAIKINGDYIVDKEKMMSGKTLKMNKKFYQCKEMKVFYKDAK